MQQSSFCLNYLTNESKYFSLAYYDIIFYIQSFGKKNDDLMKGCRRDEESLAQNNTWNSNAKDFNHMFSHDDEFGQNERSHYIITESNGCQNMIGNKEQRDVAEFVSCAVCTPMEAINTKNI